MIADPHDQPHVVLDHEDRGVKVGGDARDQRADGGRFNGTQTGGRLIEQQQFGFGRQGARQLDRLARAERQAPHRPAGGRPEVQIVDDRVGFALRRALGEAARVGTDEDVLAHRQPVEEGEVLKGARDAPPRDPVRSDPQQVLAAVADLAGCGLVQPRDAVETRGLPGAVGADEPGDAPFGNAEGRIVQCRDPAEADR